MKHWVMTTLLVGLVVFLGGCRDNPPEEDVYSEDLDGIGTVQIYHGEPDYSLAMNTPAPAEADEAQGPEGGNGDQGSGQREAGGQAGTSQPPRGTLPGMDGSQRGGTTGDSTTTSAGPTIPPAPTGDPRIAKVRESLEFLAERAKEGREELASFTSQPGQFQEISEVSKKLEEKARELEEVARGKGIQIPAGFKVSIEIPKLLPDSIMDEQSAPVRFQEDLAFVYLPGESKPMALRKGDSIDWVICLPVADRELESRYLDALDEVLESAIGMYDHAIAWVADDYLTAANAQQMFPDIRKSDLSDDWEQWQEISSEFQRKIVSPGQGGGTTGPGTPIQPPSVEGDDGNTQDDSDDSNGDSGGGGIIDNIRDRLPF